MPGVGRPFHDTTHIGGLVNMKRLRLILVALAVMSVAIVAPVSAKTTTLAITKNGYVPKTTTIETGDAVSFANQGSSAHQIVIKPSTGFTCTAGLVLQPSQTTSCTFRVAGKYQVRDPNHTSSVFKGTISVTGPTIMVTLAASPQAVTYGGTSTLSGSLATGQTGQQVLVLGMECGLTTMKQLAVSVTTTDGA